MERIIGKDDASVKQLSPIAIVWRCVSSSHFTEEHWAKLLSWISRSTSEVDGVKACISLQELAETMSLVVFLSRQFNSRSLFTITVSPCALLNSLRCFHTLASFSSSLKRSWFFPLSSESFLLYHDCAHSRASLQYVRNSVSPMA